MGANESLRLQRHAVLGEFERGPLVEFTYNGKSVKGYEGEPIAAALLAVGIRALRESKSGEPRGLFCGIGQCFECRVVVDGMQNQRSCLTPVRAGMRVETQLSPDMGEGLRGIIHAG